jgi:hypothetical protein
MTALSDVVSHTEPDITTPRNIQDVFLQRRRIARRDVKIHYPRQQEVFSVIQARPTENGGTLPGGERITPD